MGMEFLDRFQLLTENSHRLVQQKPHREPVPRLLSAGAKCPQISLMLDGVQVVAQADTGSELDLIEKFFAQTNGFRTQDLNEDDPHETELFDGRRIPLVGKILVKVGLQQRSLFSHETAPNESTTQHVKEGKATVRQTLEIESPELPQERLFYISDGLRAVVVAGQELLHSMDAFKRCFLSGKSEDCATPIFKVRNKSIGPQPSPSKWALILSLSLQHWKTAATQSELSIAIEAARQCCLASRESLVAERAKAQLRLDSGNLDASQRNEISRHLQDVERRMSQVRQDLDTTIARLSQEYNDAQQSQT